MAVFGFMHVRTCKISKNPAVVSVYMCYRAVLLATVATYMLSGPFIAAHERSWPAFYTITEIVLNYSKKTKKLEYEGKPHGCSSAFSE